MYKRQTNNRLGLKTCIPSYSIDTTASCTVRAATFTGALAGNATTATALATARTIGGVSFDGTANINLPGVNAAGNQNTSGNAATATTATLASTVTVVDSTDTSSFIAMFDSATGSLAAKTDAGLTYNAGTGMLTATGITGQLTGKASTATALATARSIAMTGYVVWSSGSFDGSGNVTAAATIQTNAVQAAMVHEDVISGRTELTSGVATDADFLLLWDATGSAYKKVKPD